MIAIILFRLQIYWHQQPKIDGIDSLTFQIFEA
jgi:hypothetical protein